jgi:patatin-like phospholipase/acyl hydrolase
MEYYHALSIDGGGVRGLLTAVLLDRLESIHPFLDDIELFAGTSTGGVLALGLAAGYKPADLCELYERHAKEVFADSLADDIKDLGMVLGSQYSNEKFIKLLEQHFGDKKLRDLPKKVLVSAFDLDNQARTGRYRTWKPKFFHNFNGFDSDGDERVVDVAVRTSAAPTFFPIYQGYIDGGVVANNPGMCALAQTINPGMAGRRLEDVVLLSMGTGINLKYLEAENEEWGIVQWARHMLSLMLEGSAGTVHYQCRMMLGARYRRINPVLPEPIGLDGFDRLELLREIGERENLNREVRWLRDYFENRKAPEISGRSSVGGLAE